MPPSAFGFKDSADFSANLTQLSEIVVEQCRDKLRMGDANIHLRRLPLAGVEYDDLTERLSDALGSPIDSCDIEMFHAGTESDTDLQLVRLHGSDNQGAIVFKKVPHTHRYESSVESYRGPEILSADVPDRGTPLSQLLLSLERGCLPINRMGEMKSRRDKHRAEAPATQSETETFRLALSDLLGAHALSTTVELVYQTFDDQLRGITIGEELVVDEDGHRLNRYAKIGLTNNHRYVIRVPDEGTKLPVQTYPERITSLPDLRSVTPNVQEGPAVFPNRRTVEEIVPILRSL